MKRYIVQLEGCDDSTNFEMVLTEAQAEVLEGLKRLSEKYSTYSCKPRLDYWEE